MKPGIYKLSFNTESYWKKMGQDSFYPYVEVKATDGWRSLTLGLLVRSCRPNLIQAMGRLISPHPG